MGKEIPRQSEVWRSAVAQWDEEFQFYDDDDDAGRWLLRTKEFSGKRKHTYMCALFSVCFHETDRPTCAASHTRTHIHTRFFSFPGSRIRPGGGWLVWKGFRETPYTVQPPRGARVNTRRIDRPWTTAAAAGSRSITSGRLGWGYVISPSSYISISLCAVGDRSGVEKP